MAPPPVPGSCRSPAYRSLGDPALAARHLAPQASSNSLRLAPAACLGPRPQPLCGLPRRIACGGQDHLNSWSCNPAFPIELIADTPVTPTCNCPASLLPATLRPADRLPHPLRTCAQTASPAQVRRPETMPRSQLPWYSKVRSPCFSTRRALRPGQAADACPGLSPEPPPQCAFGSLTGSARGSIRPHAILDDPQKEPRPQRVPAPHLQETPAAHYLLSPHPDLVREQPPARWTTTDA